MAMQQIVILSALEVPGGGMPEIGNREDIVASLLPYNTAPDTTDGDVLYGPGIQIELPPGNVPITQMLLTATDDDIAWVVIMRLARELGWKLLDPMSGRELRVHRSETSTED